MKKKLAFLAKFSLILLSMVFMGQLNAQSNLQFSARVAASSDDAEEQGANGSSPGTMDLTSSDLELVRDGNDGDQFVGIRFTNITIPQGAIVDNAYIQFTVDEDDTLTGDKFIKIEAVDNSTTFAGTNGNISARVTTQDSVVWTNIPTWPSVGAAGPDQRTPDLAMLMNRILSRSGWASGNAMNFIITGTGERVAESYDGSSSSAPELVVTYSIPAPSLLFSTRVSASSDDAEEQGANGSSPGTMDLTSSDLELVRDGNDGDQFVGIRFTNIAIPQGAVIDSAFIQFTVDEDDTLTGDKFIKAEAVDNATTFLGTNGNISSRPTTQDSVIWSNLPTWPTVGASGPDQRTPDIASVVSAIVNRQGWASGNALNIIMTGTGERVAESFDGSSGSAPEIIIYYKETTGASFQISASSDDAEEQGANGSSPGTMDLTSSDLELVRDGNDGDQFVGMRFTGVTIPQGSSIVDAYIQFTVDEDDTLTGDKFIKVELADNSSTFTGINGNISSRPVSTDSVIWTNIPTWPTVGAAGADQQTPDISSLIQTIVDRPGWLSGNALNVIMTGTGERVAESYDGSASSAPQLMVRYVSPGRYIDGDFPINKLSAWKYDDSGTDLSATNWTAINYNDTSWAFGDAILGYNNGNEATTLDFGSDPNNKYITTYLRHTFDVQNAQQYDSLIFNVLRDDGVVVYLNGTEIFRQNMPGGTVAYNTLASSAVGGSDETRYFRSAVANALINGRNVIAVELHQQAGTSSDLSFDMEVSGKLPPLATGTYPIQSGDVWNYLDNGTDLTATNWKVLNYNDTSWAYGPAALGYSNNSVTTVSFGPDANNKYITTYFRKRFNIANLASLADSIILGVRRDDGAVVYVNGAEVFRTNMPSGPIGFDTTAVVAIGGTAENTFYTTTLHKSAFVQGDNIIAVEVHQANGSSSDLSFDLEMAERPNARRSCTGINDRHFSCYTSLLPTGQGPDFVIPSTHAFQVLIEQGDSYTNQSVRTTAPGNNDFTGYIGRNGSSVDGFLGINHENTPGGFSILDLRYSDTTKLWTVDSTQAVDFYNNDLVTTTRNCSGGITPWGTFITSEETTNAGDANSDGYEDVGWQVEIDPISRKVKEYGTPGKQEKLWAMGRMSHENIAVASDSMTAYQGEDAGSGCFYKYVTNTKGDLSSGTLYALKLDSGLAGGEPVVSTGTWIVIPNATATDRNNTRSLALSLGATPFNGIEDAEIGTIDGKIYFTSKGHNRVYRFRDGASTVTQFETFVGARSYLINHGGGVASEPWGSGNDNLVFDNLGNLYVLQDGSRNHIWMVGPSHTQTNPQVDIFAITPSGSEPCGMTFSPDNKFAFVSIQHPSGGNGSTTQTDASGYGATMAQSTTVVIARKEFLGNYSPLQGATNLSFTTTACDSATLSFNSGNGTGHLVVLKEDSLVDVTPDDGITYNADATFRNGDNLGGNNYAVYDGTNTTITVRGLEQNTKYHASIFDYNESPSKYYLINAASDSVTTAAVVTGTISGNFNTAISATETYTVINTSGSTYSWDAGQGTIISGQGTNQIQVTWPSSIGSSDLKVVETNASACVGDTVIQTVNYGAVGIASFDLNEAISISPNPTDGRTTLKIMGNKEPIQLIVYDLTGKEVLKVNNIMNNYEMDLSNEGKGTYIIRLNSRYSTVTKRLIVH